MQVGSGVRDLDENYGKSGELHRTLFLAGVGVTVAIAVAGEARGRTRPPPPPPPSAKADAPSSAKALKTTTVELDVASSTTAERIASGANSVERI